MDPESRRFRCINHNMRFSNAKRLLQGQADPSKNWNKRPPNLQNPLIRGDLYFKDLTFAFLQRFPSFQSRSKHHTRLITVATNMGKSFPGPETGIWRIILRLISLFGSVFGIIASTAGTYYPINSFWYYLFVSPDNLQRKLVFAI